MGKRLITGVFLGIFLVSLIFSLGGVDAVVFAGGDGSVGNPYKISTCEQLQGINQNLNAHYILIRDIDCSIINKYDWQPIGKLNPGDYVGEEIGDSSFQGTLDGNAHIIKNLEIVRQGWGTGIFGYVGSNGKVKNLGLEDVFIYGYGKEGEYNGNYIGALVGYNKGTIEGCFVKQKNQYITEIDKGIEGDDFVGGLVGGNKGTIKNCYTSNQLIKGRYAIGGLVGQNTNPGKVEFSYSTSSILMVKGSGGGFCGGLTGWNGILSLQESDLGGAGEIKGSFSVGKVGCRDYRTCLDSSSGFIGMGGFIGFLSSGGIIQNNYWYDYPTSEPYSGYGSYTREDAAYNGIRIIKGGSQSIELEKKDLDYFKGNVRYKAPFNSWDFTNVWVQISGDFPRLKWEVSRDSWESTENDCINIGGYCKWTWGILSCNSGEQSIPTISCGILRTCCKATQPDNIIDGCVEDINVNECWLEDNFCTDDCECQTGYVQSAGNPGACVIYSELNCGSDHRSIVSSLTSTSSNLCTSGTTASNFRETATGWAWKCGASNCFATKTTTPDPDPNGGGTTIPTTDITCNENVNGKTFENLFDVPAEKCSDDSDSMLVQVGSTNEYRWRCEEETCKLFLKDDPKEIPSEYYVESDKGCDLGKEFETIIYKDKATNQQVGNAQKIYCPAALPFFTIRNVVAVVILIGLVYIIFALRNQNKKSSKKKKRR